MTDYIIFGVIMLIMVVAGILIIRQQAKKEVSVQQSVMETLFGIFEFLDF
jgi:uncharacterized protein YhhL (DUF1145 family)